MWPQRVTAPCSPVSQANTCCALIYISHREHASHIQAAGGQKAVDAYKKKLEKHQQKVENENKRKLEEYRQSQLQRQSRAEKYMVDDDALEEEPLW
jgi:hypothetical protein